MPSAPSAPKLEARTANSLSLSIEIPPDYNGEYRVQYYEAGYMYNSSWKTKDIQPSAADSASDVAGWDADGKPMFTDRVVYTLAPLQPNKCYVVRTGLKIEGATWMNSAKSTFLYTLGTDGEEGDLQKSMVLEREGSICEAPGDTDEESTENMERKEPEEADWTPVSHPGGTHDAGGAPDASQETQESSDTPPPTSQATMATSVDSQFDSQFSLGSSSDSLGSITDIDQNATGQPTAEMAPAEENQELARAQEIIAELRAQANCAEQTRIAHEAEKKQLRQLLLAATEKHEQLEQQLLAAPPPPLPPPPLQGVHEKEVARDRDQDHEQRLVQLRKQLTKQHQAAIREKENELNEAFQRMLAENATSKQQLEASSAQLLEGRIHSIQAALDEQAQQALRWKTESEQTHAELALAQQALQETELELDVSKQAQQALQEQLCGINAEMERAAAAAGVPPPPVSPPPYNAAVTGTISASSTYIAAPASSEPKIAFTSFTSGDLALFLPVEISSLAGTNTDTEAGSGSAGSAGGEQKMAYLAFNHGCPHHYVAEECMTSLRAADGTMPSFFLGRVFMVDDHEVQSAQQQQPNPYNLPVGTEYHTLLVEAFE